MFTVATVYGVELNPPSGALPGLTAQLIKKTAELVEAIDRDGKLVIVAHKEEADTLVEYYSDKNAFGERYTLVQLSNSTKASSSLTDYGFTSQTNNHYLYRNMVTGFSISKGDKEQIEMALLQIEEHLIATDGNVFYVDIMQKELMEGIARAYEIELSF